MNHLSLFSGIGGLDLAAEWAGFTTVAFVERDPYCQRVLAKRWPGVPIFSDVRDVGYAAGSRWDGASAETGGDLRELAGEVRGSSGGGVCIVSGGFPCQPHSVAGKRQASADDRDLWPEFARVIREIRPRWVVAENVPGLLHSESGRFFGQVLGDLADMGYSAGWGVWGAADVGALHRRERVFIVAYASRDVQPERQESGAERERAGAGGEPVNVADAGRGRLRGSGGGKIQQPRRAETVCSGETVADTHGPRLEERVLHAGGEGGAGRSLPREEPPLGDWWLAEPDVGGRSHGLPARLDGGLNGPQTAGPCDEELREVWDALRSQSLREGFGGFQAVPAEALLFSFLRQYEGRPDEARLLLASPEALEGFLRGVRGAEASTGPSHRPGQDEQRADEYSDALQVVSRLSSLHSQTPWDSGRWEDGIPRVAKGVPDRVARLRALGNAVVPQQAYPLFAEIARIEGMKTVHPMSDVL